MPVVRLDKIVTGSGPYTNSEAAMLIKHGHVSVDGCVVLTCGKKYETESACIAIDNERVIYQRFSYIMLNKPAGYVSATYDKRDKTVMELLDDKYSKYGLFPVGRLDKDVDGLLILTNDGSYAHRVTSPSTGIYKRYFAQIDGSITGADIKSFADGLVLGDGTKCKAAVLETAPGGVHVQLCEGKHHQVKRMMAAIGKPVVRLTRISIGGLDLDRSLTPGNYRELFDEAFLVFNEKETNN